MTQALAPMLLLPSDTEVCANVFFVFTDSNGREGMDFALVPNEEYFKQKLREFWREAGGKVRFMSREKYMQLKYAHPSGNLN